MSEPPITTQAVHVSAGLNDPVTRIVIHATCPPGIAYPAASAAGQAIATARYFTSQSSGGSAHYIEDIVDEQHCVADSAIAWHAPPNRGSIGIEICGEDSYTRSQWLAPDVWPAVARAAARTRELADRFGVPLQLLNAADLRSGSHGICGHVDVSEAFHQSDHTDPGPNFPWDAFMQAVVGGTPPPVINPPTQPVPKSEVPCDMATLTTEGPIPFTLNAGGEGWLHVDVPFDKITGFFAQGSNPDRDGTLYESIDIQAQPDGDGTMFSFRRLTTGHPVSGLFVKSVA